MMFGDGLKQDDEMGVRTRPGVRIGSNSPITTTSQGALFLGLYTNLKSSIAQPNKSSKNYHSIISSVVS
jgi:hypothetical protein